jgi:hypothetical protein
MNQTSSFRRTAATLTIGSFSLAALMGIVALLGGGDFGTGEARVLLTTLIVGCASVCMLCYLATTGTRWGVIGVGGSVVLVVPVLTSMILVWSDWDTDMDGVWKAYGVGVVAAATLAQICMLLALAGDRPALGFVLWSTVGLAAFLAVLVSGAILGEVDMDDFWRLIGVIAILDVLGTLVTIALAKFAGRSASETRGTKQNGQVRLTISEAHSNAVVELSRETGRAPAAVVAEAMGRYLDATNANRH